MTYFIEFIKSPLNILIIILLLFSLFIVLGTYREGFTSTEVTGQTYTDVSGNIYINGTEITDTNFTGPNGNNAEIIAVNGDYEIIVTDASGNETTYNFNMPTTSNSSSSSSSSSSSNSSSSSTLYSTTFYGQNGGTAEIISGPNGSNLIQITNSNGQITTFSSNNPSSSSSSYSNSSSSPSSSSSSLYSTTFYGQNGGTAQIISGSNGSNIIQITNSNGQITTFSTNNPSSSSSSSSNSYNSSTGLYNTTFYGQNGGTAQIITGPNGSNLIQITNSNGQITTFSPNNSSSSYSVYTPPPTSYPPTSYPPTSYPPTSYPPPPTNSSYSSPYSSYSDDYTSPYTQTSSPYTQSSPTSSYNYSSSLPPGIPMSQIPPGQEDLYILKSEIVPPVCPAPVPAVQSSTEQCAPCPPCARCPQPNFECKKVPNYSSSNNDLPTASMSPYSTYGS